MWNVHRMSIKIEHRNLEIRKNTYDFLVQIRNLLLALSLKVLQHKERDTHSFYSGFFICPHSPSRATPAQGFGEPAKVDPSRSVSSSQFNSDFFKIPKSSARFRCVTSFALACPVSYLRLLWHLWLTRPLCARAWTPTLMLHLSNPCTEPKGSQPN